MNFIINKRIKYLRNVRGENQEKLINVLHIARTTIVYLENGDEPITESTRRKLAAYFEVPLVYFKESKKNDKINTILERTYEILLNNDLGFFK